MTDTTRSAAAATSPELVFERTYRASVDELWELWTTKEGFESWWPPRGVPRQGSRHRSAAERQAAV